MAALKLTQCTYAPALSSRPAARPLSPIIQQKASKKRSVPSSPICVMEDFEVLDGPLEPTLPKFSRGPYPSSSESQTPSSETPGVSKRRRGRGRPFRKATPVQALVGAVLGGGWAVVALKATEHAYDHLQKHPAAHDLPLGLTSEVNQLLLTMLGGFGGLAVCMFGVSSLGLALLAVKLILSPNPPIQP